MCMINTHCPRIVSMSGQHIKVAGKECLMIFIQVNYMWLSYQRQYVSENLPFVDELLQGNFLQLSKKNNPTLFFFHANMLVDQARCTSSCMTSVSITLNFITGHNYLHTDTTTKPMSPTHYHDI